MRSPGRYSRRVKDTSMGRFWDERADEDAFFFVDNRLKYGSPDQQEFWEGGRRDLDALLNVVDARIESDDVVVEIGCGVGRLTRVIAERAAGVRALDVSSHMLERARELNPSLGNVEWIHGDGTRLPGVEDASADACVSYVVFQHIPDPEITLAYVREMGRVLKPGGWAAFQVSTDPSIHQSPGRGSVLGWIRSLAGRAPKGQDAPAWLGSAVDLDGLRSAAQEGGMNLERVENAGTQFCVVRTRRAST